MAKKLSRGKLAVLRSRSTGFALIGVMGFLIAGFVFQPIASTIPIIAPVFDEQFEIPFVPSEIDENNQEISDQIQEIISDETIPPEEASSMVEDLQKEIQTIPTITNETSIVCTDSIPQTCNVIPTITSEDPTLVQIGDILDDNPILNPLLPQSASLNLLTKITKQDSTGKRTVVEKTTQFSQLAFLVEEGTNIDYRNGFLEIEMFVKGKMIIF